MGEGEGLGMWARGPEESALRTLSPECRTRSSARSRDPDRARTPGPPGPRSLEREPLSRDTEVLSRDTEARSRESDRWVCMSAREPPE